MASDGHLELVSTLLEWGIGTNRHSKTALATALCAAAESGHFDVMRLLLENGAQADKMRCPVGH